MLVKIKYYLYVVGAALLAGLAIFGKVLKGQRDRAREERDTLQATVNAERKKKKIVKDKEVELSRKESEIKERIKDVKEPEDLDNLFDNDGW
jgi:hypothetical protein